MNKKNTKHTRSHKHTELEAEAKATTAESTVNASTGTATAACQMAFADLGLSDKVLSAVSEMGYETPSPVQREAIPYVLAGRDVMAAAQTGTGKTAAFLLPSLDRLGHAHKGAGPLMLVVTPTRELAQQIDEAAATICKKTGHKRAVLVGGVGYEPQRAALRRGCDLLVATPGRLIDLIDQGAADLSQVRTLVLDEADRMLDMGFLPSVRKIVERTPRNRQTLLFSATLSDDVLDHTRSLVDHPARVEIAPKGTAAETVEQYVLPVVHSAKNKVLEQVLHREGWERVIVFSRGKHRADSICRKLRKAGYSCAPIHGNRSQNQRERALRGFREGDIDILVATDVLARGIDIPDVSYVINLDVPGDAEDYIHRIGRTGRAGETGWALTFVTEDDYLELRDAEKLMGRVIPPFPRTEGLDLGTAEELSFLDPYRNPKDKLPGKKARKKMAEARADRREAAGADSDRGSRGAQGKGKGDSRKGSSHKTDSRKADSHKADSHKGDSRKADSPKGKSAKGKSAKSGGQMKGAVHETKEPRKKDRARRADSKRGVGRPANADTSADSSARGRGGRGRSQEGRSSKRMVGNFVAEGRGRGTRDISSRYGSGKKPQRTQRPSGRRHPGDRGGR